MSKVKAIILAGGIGKRMWPIKTNKVFLPFFGEPLLLDNLRRIEKAGIGDLIIVTTPGIFASVKKLAVPLKIPVVLQPQPLGQADAILKTAELIKNQEVLVINANDLFSPDLVKKMVREARKAKSDAALPAVSVDTYFPGGYLIIKNKRILKIIEKPKPGKEPSNLVKLDIDYFRHGSQLIRALKETQSRQDDVFELAMNKMIDQGSKFLAIDYQGYWGPIKYPWDVLKVMDLFFKFRFPQRKGKKPDVSPPVTITGPVIFEEGVRILEGAKVRGPAYIGAGTIIGNHSLVRESMIGANCVVGYGTEIARSYVGNNCWFHSSYIGDSVLGDNVSLGAGAVLANLRFDEGKVSSFVGGKKVDTGLDKLGAMIGDNVKVGVNASLMPGVKIGSNSFVGPGVVLDRDLSENRFCRLKQSLAIEQNVKLSPLKNREKFRKKI